MAGGETLLKRYCGAFLLMCMVLGGGTESGLWTDFVLQMTAIPLVCVALIGGGARYAKVVLVFVGAIIAAQLIQFIPRVWEGADYTLLTRDVGRSIDLLVFSTVFASFFLALGKLSNHSLERLIPFVILGLVINVTIAFFQFSSSSRSISGLLPYELAAGLYANANHFSSLVFVCIPVFIAFCWVHERIGAAIGGIAILVFFEFVVRSTAGIFLSLACAAVTFWVLRDGRRTGVRAHWVLAAAAGLVLLAANAGRFVGSELAPYLNAEAERLTFAANTLSAAWAYLPFGSGFGTLPIIYPQFEAVHEIDNYFVNHAHNDYLELLADGGMLAGALMAGYLALLLVGYRDARRSKLSMSALCGIGFVLIHSVVDYPLRTMGVAGVFVFLNALYFVPSGETASVRRDRDYYLARRAPKLVAP